MASIMITLMVTMTDVFYAIGDFSQMIFRGMKKIGHIPNVIIWVILFCLLVYWTIQIIKQTKEAHKNGTLE